MRDDKPITWSKSLRSRGETMVLQLGAVQFEHLLRRDIVLQDKVLQAVQMVEEYRNTKAIQSIWCEPPIASLLSEDNEVTTPPTVG